MKTLSLYTVFICRILYVRRQKKKIVLRSGPTHLFSISGDIFFLFEILLKSFKLSVFFVFFLPNFLEKTSDFFSNFFLVFLRSFLPQGKKKESCPWPVVCKHKIGVLLLLLLSSYLDNTITIKVAIFQKEILQFFPFLIIVLLFKLAFLYTPT